MEVGEEARGRRPETIQEGGGRGVQEAIKVGSTRGGRPETIQEGGGRGMQEAMTSRGSHQRGEARDNTGGRR